MIRPPTSGIALPDTRGAVAQSWFVGYCVAGGLFVVAAATTLVLYPITLTSRAFTAIFLSMAATLLFAVASLVCLAIWQSHLSATRTELADALLRAGYHGVDAKRLLGRATARAAVPASAASPPAGAGVTLRLRRERDDQGRRWLLVDAAPEAGQAD
ncbi:hypothetical protein ACIRCZ_04045 [Leifsonia sp. NPDC102414]|uniref:hypothetical protein n=1 Tax=Leifsonia sp. NPDC102414 TaxID=3364124 RepID=UPI00380F76F0